MPTWCTCRRKHRFAADSGLGALLDAIRAGDVARVRKLLEAGAQGAVRWLQPSAASRTQVVSALREGYAPLLQARDPLAALEAMSRFRVLCALREGMSGTRGLNPWIEARLGAPGARIPVPWLVEANDALVGLYNGDLGVSLPADGSAIWFGAGSAARVVARARLPAHASAWAMTVHKAQGSEFDAVMVLLPPRPHPLVIARVALHRAQSRAAKGDPVCRAGGGGRGRAGAGIAPLGLGRPPGRGRRVRLARRPVARAAVFDIEQAAPGSPPRAKKHQLAQALADWAWIGTRIANCASWTSHAPTSSRRSSASA